MQSSMRGLHSYCYLIVHALIDNRAAAAVLTPGVLSRLQHRHALLFAWGHACVRTLLALAPSYLQQWEAIQVLALQRQLLGLSL